MNAAMSGGLTSFMMTTFFMGLFGYTTALVAQFLGAGRKDLCAVDHLGVDPGAVGAPVLDIEGAVGCARDGRVVTRHLLRRQLDVAVAGPSHANAPLGQLEGQEPFELYVHIESRHGPISLYSKVSIWRPEVKGPERRIHGFT